MSASPFPQGVSLDALTPRPEESTALARLRTVIGEQAAKVHGRDLQKMGARAAAGFRAQFHQEPPRVMESHPELGGPIAVFCYPGPVAVACLDEAIKTVLALSDYKAPPPPSAAGQQVPAEPWRPAWLAKMTEERGKGAMEL